MSHLYVAVLAVIVVTLLSVSLYRTTQVKTKADYLVAGRSLPAIVLVLTLLSSWIGGGSLFGGAANAYANGFAALWQPASGRLPERCKAIRVSVCRPAKERTATDPRAEQREHQNNGRQGSPGDQVIGLGFHLGGAIERNRQQRNDDDGQNSYIEMRHPRKPSLKSEHCRQCTGCGCCPALPHRQDVI